MPFKISDEALDALDRAGNDERVKFFGTLSDDERSQIAAALPAWKAKKQAPVAPPPEPSKLDPLLPSAQTVGPFMPPDAGELNYTPAPPKPETMVEKFQNFTPPDEPLKSNSPFVDNAEIAQRVQNFGQEFQEQNAKLKREHPILGNLPGAEMFAAAQTVGQEMTGPAMEKFQSDVGSPVTEQVVKGVNEVANIPSKIYGEDVLPPQKIGGDKEYLLRSSLQWLGGPEALEKMPVPAQLEALWTLEKAYGVTGAAFAQAVATVGGASVPMLFVNPGAGAVLGDAAESAYMAKRGLTAATMAQAPLLTKLMVQSAKTLGSSIGTGIEGGVMGGGQAMLTGQDIGEGIKTGMASGSLLDLGMNAGSMGLQAGKAGLKRAAIVVPSVATKILREEIPRLIDYMNARRDPAGQLSPAFTGRFPDGSNFQFAKPGTVPVSEYFVHLDKKGDPALYGVSINAKTGKVIVTEEKITPGNYQVFKKLDKTPTISREVLATDAVDFKEMNKQIDVFNKTRARRKEISAAAKKEANRAEGETILDNGDTRTGMSSTFNPGDPTKFDPRAARPPAIEWPRGREGKPMLVREKVVDNAPKDETTRLDPYAKRPMNIEWPNGKSGRPVRLEDLTLIDEPIDVVPDTSPATLVDVHPDGRLEFNSLEGRSLNDNVDADSDPWMDLLGPKLEQAIADHAQLSRKFGGVGETYRFVGEDNGEYSPALEDDLRTAHVPDLSANDNVDPKFSTQKAKRLPLNSEGVTVSPELMALRDNWMRADQNFEKAATPENKRAVWTARNEYKRKLIEDISGIETTQTATDTSKYVEHAKLRNDLDAARQENNRLKGEDTDPGVPDFIPGEEVYWRPTGTTDGHAVDYLGKSPNDPNGHTALIRVNGQVKEVPWEQVYPKNPWGFDRAPLAPPPPESPSEFGAKFAALNPQLNAKAEVAAKFIKATEELRQKQPSVWARLFKNKAAQAGGDIEAIMNRIWSIGRAGDARAVSEELRKIVSAKGPGMGLDGAFDRDIARLFEGKETFSDMLLKYPEQAGNLQKVFKPYMDEIKRDFDMNAQLMKDVHDGVVDLPTYNEMMGYIARGYRAYTLPPGEWAKLVPENTIKNAADYILKASPVKMTEGQLIVKLRELLNTEDPMAALLNMGVGNKAWKNLKAREQIPFVIRKLMGEETSGVIRITNSIAKLRALNAGLEAMGQIVKGGTLAQGIDANPLWSPGPRADLHTEQVPNNRMLYGKAAGGYVHKDLWPMVEAIQHAKNPFPVWQQLAGLTKANLVALGGVGPWLNATMGNWMWNGMLHGQLSPWRPAKTAHYLSRALSDFQSSGEIGVGKFHASSENPAVQRVLMAKKYGADVLGMHGNELMPPGSPFYKHLQETLGGAKAPKTPAEWISSMGKAAAEGINKGYGKASHYYDFIDRAFRYGSFLADFDELMATGKYTEHEAATEAARRVNRYFPNASHPNPIAAKMRASPAGFLARFSFDFTEQMRVLGNMIEDVKKGDKKMLGRLAAGGLMGTAIWQGNKFLRRENGISDAEVNGYFNQQSDTGQSTYTPLAMALPWRDAQGRVQRVDPGNWFWWARLMKKKPDTNMATAIPLNALLEMANGGTSENALRAMLDNANLGDFSMPDRKTRPWEKGIPALASMLARQGAVPGAAMRAYDTAKGMGAVGQSSPFKEELTPGQAAMYLLGIPGVTPMGDKNYKASKVELQQAAKEYKGNIIKANKELSGEDRKAAKQQLREDFKHQKQQKHERSEAHRDTKEN